MKKRQGTWVVRAPNKKEVYLNMGGYGDTYFKHRSEIHDPKWNKAFPNIFIQIVPETIIEEEPIKTKTKETIVNPEQGKPQILTEVPEPKTFAPEKDKPKRTAEDSDEDDSESDNPKPKRAGRPPGAKNKKTRSDKGAKRKKSKNSEKKF